MGIAFLILISIELIVKYSYDIYAKRVLIEFGKDEKKYTVSDILNVTFHRHLLYNLVNLFFCIIVFFVFQKTFLFRTRLLFCILLFILVYFFCKYL